MSWFGAAGEDNVCGTHSRSVKCIALLGSKRPRQSAMDFNGIRRLYLPLRPKARFSLGRKTQPSVSAPSTGLRPLNVSRVKCGGRTLSRPLSASVCGKYDMPTMRLYKRIALDLISACREHVVAATGSSPFKVRDASGTDHVRCRKNLRLSLPSPTIA